MQTVQAFMIRRAGQQAGQGATSSFSGKTLGGMSRGVDALSSIAEFAAGQQRAASLRQEARDERLAGRLEYTRADEAINAIDARYNAMVGAQLAATGEMGIDPSSGSVVAARNALRDEADRERRTLRNSADMNASLRRLRSLNLRNQARNQSILSTAKLVMDLGSSIAGGR
ncbi:MAG: hypothetical protein ACK4E3_10480 [Brevundimonas sp.]|uniref:hypothetical protein n=1 Tax=Brevundimonas sp. TaxID=1871086 RepID=UPI00391D1A34